MLAYTNPYWRFAIIVYHVLGYTTTKHPYAWTIELGYIIMTGNEIMDISIHNMMYRNCIISIRTFHSLKDFPPLFSYKIEALPGQGHSSDKLVRLPTLELPLTSTISKGPKGCQESVTSWKDPAEWCYYKDIWHSLVIG